MPRSLPGPSCLAHGAAIVFFLIGVESPNSCSKRGTKDEAESIRPIRDWVVWMLLIWTRKSLLILLVKELLLHLASLAI